MKRFPLLMLLTVLACMVSAQPGGFMQNKADQIDMLRRQFFRQRVGFTSEEEEKFWPVYYEYTESIKRIRLDIRSKTLVLDRGVENLSEQQLNALIETFIEQKKKEAEVYATYVGKLKGILPPDKIVKVYLAERAFLKELVNRLRQRGAPIPPELEGGMP